MEITDIRIRKISDDSKMRAIVSVTFDDELVIHDIKIIEGYDKVFLAMPSRRLSNGNFSDIAHPTKKDLRDRIEAQVLTEFERYKQGEFEN
ncbi:MAG: septation regulator SpoVG [Oscillospiraceae bacterium]|nr:septation regulator SpoVG [Oscillospiraceae bacterium]